MGIEHIEIWTVDEKLQHPVVFGNMSFASRDYTVVRLTDADGAIGVAYGLGRGAPVAAMADGLAGAVIGCEPEASEAIWDDLYARTITSGQRGVAMRAISLLDIAIWDLRAKRAGLPLHALLGRRFESVVASVGGGYYRDRRDRDDITAELRTYAESGFQIVKIPAGGLSARDEARWVSDAREAVGPDVDLAIDTHWTWSDVRSARKVLERLEEFRLDWIEDPLWPEALAAAAELRSHLRTPIAIGDELSGRWAYQQMLEPRAADIWRVDVTTVGGFTEARRILGLASAWGIAVSPHIYAELHVHLAASHANVLAVEYVTPESEIDLSHRFVADPIRPSAGRMAVPTGLGLGVELDFERVGSLATAHFMR